MQPSSLFVNQFNGPVFQFLISENWGYRIVRHGLLNVVLIFIFFYQYYVTDPMPEDPQAPMVKFLLSAILYLISATLVYLNVYWFVPRFLFHGRLSAYLMVCATGAIFYTVCIFGLSPLVNLILREPIPPDPFSWGNFIDTFILPSIFLGSTTGIKVLKKWILDTIRINELEKRQLQEELNQLKNQVNPHFLFNTLNNLHALTRIDPEKASQVLLNLSDILRYQLYESNREKVLLSRDIENIRQLLALEKVRRDHFDYQIDLIGNIDGRLLPPFLFTSFVENAIKHSQSATDKATIELKINIQEEILTFECSNSKPEFADKKEIGGLGLNNIKRRLELLYPANHHLAVEDTAMTYCITMNIPL